MASDSEVASQSRRPTLGHLPALDGVRALAVVAVVLYHAGVAPVRGGFLGVDVFFVLSGFLITSLLVKEREATGRVSLARFYERRARRLLPALVVLVALVVVFADQVVPHGSYPTLSNQIIGTMAYVGNWTLLSNHSTYFSLGLPPSPLQHTWSLAIEEQFYLLWPAILLCLGLAFRRRAQYVAACLAGAVVCTVVTAALFKGIQSVNALYFETQTHVTTLLCGAALAFLALRRPGASTDGAYVAAPPRRRNVVDAIGVLAWAGVLASFFLVSGTGALLYRGGYLAFGAVVAVALGCTVLVPNGWSSRALSLPPIAYLGRISYGIYLYHFPLFLWLDAERVGLGGTPLLCVRLAAAVGVAAISSVVVEQPVREGRLLRGAAGLIGGVAAYALVCGVAFSVTAAAALVPFPDLVARKGFVHHAPPGTTTSVLIVGDSMAQTLGNGLNDPVARAAHLYVFVDGNPVCSLIGGRLRIKGFRVNSPRKCELAPPKGWPRRWGLTVLHHHPALSMALYRLDTVDHRLDGRWQHIGDPQFDCTLRNRMVLLAETLSATRRPVAFLTTPYYDSGEQTDGSPWPEDAPWRVNEYNQMLEQVAARFPDVIHVVDLNALLDPGGAFTRTIGSTVVRWVDGVHLTYAGDSYLLPKLLPTIEVLARDTPTRAAERALAVAAAAATTATCPR